MSFANIFSSPVVYKLIFMESVFCWTVFNFDEVHFVKFFFHEYTFYGVYLKSYCQNWASLLVQWLRTYLLMQETRIWSLIQEDSICCGPTKPVYHNYWACALEPISCTCWALGPQLLKLTCPKACNKRSHLNEKPTHQNQRVAPIVATRESPCAATRCSTVKNKMSKYIKIFKSYCRNQGNLDFLLCYLRSFIVCILHLGLWSQAN